ARAARRRFGGRDIDLMHGNDLQAARRVRQIADDGRARRQFGVARRLQRRGVAESVAAIIQGDEAVTLGAVEPLYLTLRRSLRDGFGTLTAEVCHATDITFPAGYPPISTPGRLRGRTPRMMTTETPDSQAGGGTAPGNAAPQQKG